MKKHETLKNINILNNHFGKKQIFVKNLLKNRTFFEKKLQI